jgi:hypothetical protein
VLATLAAFGAAKEKPKKAAQAQALVAGSVFHSSGHAMRGAQVVVTPAGPGKKKGEWKAFTDSRGEFHVRVPAGPASYNVVVRFEGYKPVEKTVEFAADERADLSLLMEPGAAK